MHIKYLIAVPLLVYGFILSPSAMASEVQWKSMNKNIDSCQGSTAVEVRICAERKLEIADRELGSSYNGLMSIIESLYDKEESSKSQYILKESQRAWRYFINSECNFSGQIDRYGGTDEWKRASSLLCKVKMTNERKNDLQGYINEIKLK